MDELITDFLTETVEGLAKLDNDLILLEKSPQDQQLLGNIFRVMHTIKGTCGFLGLSRLEVVAHAGENVLGKIRDKALHASPKAITLILEVVDAIKFIVDGLSATGKEPEGEDSELIGRVNAHAEGKDQADTGMISLAPAAPVVAAESEHAVAESKKKEAITAAAVPETTAIQPQQSLRVNIDVLEQLMQQASELVLTRNQLLQIGRTSQDSSFHVPLQRLNHITSELQDVVMKTRMQPVGNAWAKFPRLVRDLSNELHKNIELVMAGEETELDRQLLEYIKDPLTHMVRNSADHGIDTPEERKAAGKSEKGTITLDAYHESGHIVIRIADDGRGLNVERIKAKILEKGLASPEELASMSAKQIQYFIFHAGFSTAATITSVSGRGVGMDVVRTNIEKIGGNIDMQSVQGKGTTFLIKIPLTLAIMPILIVEAGGERFGIPQLGVLEMVRTGPHSEHHIEMINGAQVLRLRNRLLPLISLREALKMAPAPELTTEELAKKKVYIVVCQVGNSYFGIAVDKVFDTEEIVVKSVAPVLRHINVYAGSTILGDGSVIMILDINGISGKVGNMDIGQQTGLAEQHDATEEAHDFTLLMFRSGEGAPKVVPLEVVSRLEKIDLSKIELSAGIPLLQYRGGLMRVVSLDGEPLDVKPEIREIIVFVDEDKVMGMVVDQIEDIVTCHMDTRLSSGKEGFLGSPVVQGVTCELIDVSYHFQRTFQDWEVGGHNAPTHKNKMVLLVDDSPFFRKFIPPVLKNAGYDVLTAPGAEEALEILAAQTDKLSLIITDMNMPGMTGPQFIAVCKQDARFSNLPIIALSAHSTEEMGSSMEESLLEQLSGYVSKTNHGGLLDLVNSTAGGIH
ncbi:MAG: hybrid sensor histidine kinase/response regulator [Rickettsiales bacterium]|jgi:two-component system chemotaxis sensor kinase CheA|nr:hybrid sensor histidine kinase/response regulator [Rickettsiales bacterium]